MSPIFAFNFSGERLQASDDGGVFGGNVFCLADIVGQIKKCQGSVPSNAK